MLQLYLSFHSSIDCPNRMWSKAVLHEWERLNVCCVAPKKNLSDLLHNIRIISSNKSGSKGYIIKQRDTWFFSITQTKFKQVVLYELTWELVISTNSYYVEFEEFKQVVETTKRFEYFIWIVYLVNNLSELADLFISWDSLYVLPQPHLIWKVPIR